ncbi:hypothetical protein BLNAU_14977 [Blattamonas nauphoetae]|uniref:Uncharacterized protein n=1 Tax=Blattamonas nauphoetae TaxID=2049346 RepID=A0ABQ9XFQ2_9EUKA|nr:hypothetical protein BLNAU_14977 [Blattamonas nauphoetae]
MKETKCTASSPTLSDSSFANSLSQANSLTFGLEAAPVHSPLRSGLKANRLFPHRTQPATVMSSTPPNSPILSPSSVFSLITTSSAEVDDDTGHFFYQAFHHTSHSSSPPPSSLEYQSLMLSPSFPEYNPQSSSLSPPLSPTAQDASIATNPS